MVIPDDLAAFGFVLCDDEPPHWLRACNVTITGKDFTEVCQRARAFIVAREAIRTAQAEPKPGRKGKIPAPARMASQGDTKAALPEQLGLL